MKNGTIEQRVRALDDQRIPVLEIAKQISKKHGFSQSSVIGYIRASRAGMKRASDYQNRKSQRRGFMSVAEERKYHLEKNNGESPEEFLERMEDRRSLFRNGFQEISSETLESIPEETNGKINNGDLYGIIKTAMRVALTPGERIVLEATYYDDMSIRQISKDPGTLLELGRSKMNHQNVFVIKKRALEKMKRYFNKRDIFS